MPKTPFDVGFIGTGNMGAMLVRAFLRSGSIEAKNVWAANRSQQKLEVLASEFPGIHRDHASHVAQRSDVLFLAVKPGDTKNVLETIQDSLRPDQLCVFLTNVFSFEQLEQRLPCAVAKLIPTVTQQIGRGVALLAHGQRATSEHTLRLEKLLAGTCTPLIIKEHQMRLFADIASCGPAFLAVCIEEICRQALAFNGTLSAEDLTAACIETLGATADLLRTGMTPQQLVCEVAVPGGMTEAGIAALRRLLPQLLASVFSATRQTEQQKGQLFSLD
ncbi:MAG TPA: NAD(P)-binding domain-containing protein [Candidatus Solibacter sp.]|jgi:competence protein ComER|nr:NAD(P)-binding domain-containing protein [Candidatus Solibacter sp.]